MDVKKQIESILSASPLPIPPALSLVNRLAPNKLDLYRFHALPVNLKRKRLKKALEELARMQVSEMPVVQISATLAPKKKSISQLLAEESKLKFEELPDALKLLVIRRYECKRIAVDAHRQMREAPDNENRLAASLRCNEAMAENWKIWTEIAHFAKTGEVLGKHEQFKLDKFELQIAEIESNNSALEAAKLLLGKLRTAKNRIYKLRKENEAEALLNKWIDRYNRLAKKLNEPLWQDK